MTEQMKQAERNQQAVIRQGRANALVELNLRLTDPAMADLIPKHGEPVGSYRQLSQIMAYQRALLQHLQENFHQHREGLLNEQDFEEFVRSTSVVMPSPFFRVIWRTLKPMFMDDFVAFVDGQMARTPLVKFDQDAIVAKFNHDFQAELANAR